MTKFIVDKKSDALKTDINLVFTTTSCRIARSRSLTRRMNFKFVCLSAYWPWKLANERTWNFAVIVTNVVDYWWKSTSILPQSAFSNWLSQVRIHTGFWKSARFFQNVSGTHQVDLKSPKYYLREHAPDPSRSFRLRHLFWKSVTI